MFNRRIPPPAPALQTAFEERTAVDVVLGAVSTWNAGYNHLDLYFKPYELAKLYTPENQLLHSDAEFLALAQARFPGSHVVDMHDSERYILRIPKELMNEVITQLSAVRVIAHTKFHPPQR